MKAMKIRKLQHKVVFTRIFAALLMVFFTFGQAAPVLAQAAADKTDYNSQDNVRRNDGSWFSESCAGDSAGASPTPDTTNGNGVADGLTTGASIYGGQYVNGVWKHANTSQGVEDGLSSDDNGLGTDGKPLGSQINGKPAKDAAKFASFAELEMGNALGHLKDKQRLKITNPKNGKTVIAEKRDIGGGGDDVINPDTGKPVKRGIDLWWETAKLLDFTDGTGIVQYTKVDDNTPLTLLTGGVSEGPAASDGGTCCLTDNNSLSPLVGNGNVQQAFNFFVQKFTDIGQGANAKMIAAAIVGNLQHESADKKLNPAAVNPTSGAYGIAQWLGARAKQLKSHEGSQSGTLAGQLDFIWYEISKGSQVSFKVIPRMSHPKGSSDIEKVKYLAREWEDSFERSGGAGIPQREANAVALYKDPNLGGGASVGGSATNSDTIGNCSCDDGSITVLLDPGHTGASNPKTETAEGIKAQDSSGAPGENENMWKAAKDVKGQLEKAGYHVEMTKKSADDDPGLIGRARIANQLKADIAVSMHYDDSQSWSEMAWVTPQTTDNGGLNGPKTIPGDSETRTHRTTGGNTKYFDKTPTAKELQTKSTQYAKAMVDARNKAEGRNNAQLHTLVFPKSRGLAASGNMATVQLFSTVPWVYNEVGAKGGSFNEKKYAQGVADGIKKALPLSGAQAQAGQAGDTSGNSPDCGAGGTGAVAKALFYAWPTHTNPPYFVYKPTYKIAVDAALKKHLYVGGGRHPGIDCGGYVTRVMQDSGADPNYNKSPAGAVDTQEAYMKKHPDKYKLIGNVTSTAKLQPGDIAIENNDAHTYLYVGKQPNFQTKVASASYSTHPDNDPSGSWRTPMAGIDALSGFRFYRPTNGGANGGR